MAKIILTLNNEVLRDIALLKERITIGRALHNDLVIDNRAVSAEHAVIVTVNKDSFLEDLNSTNGTQVNGQPIKKHFLQENDVIELAQYRLTYVCNSLGDQVFNSEHVSERRFSLNSYGVPAIRVLSGVNAGKKTPLTKALTTIGRPGVQVAVIAQQTDGFYLNQVEGKHGVMVNGESLSTQGHRLHQGDVIDLAGAQIEFLLIS